MNPDYGLGLTRFKNLNHEEYMDFLNEAGACDEGIGCPKNRHFFKTAFSALYHSLWKS